MSECTKHNTFCYCPQCCKDGGCMRDRNAAETINAEDEEYELTGPSYARRLVKKQPKVAAPTPQPADGVVVPRDVVLFLLGEGTLDGVWFGGEATARYSYWWRKPLRDALLAAAKEPR